MYAVNTHLHADHVTGTGMIKRQIPTCRSVISKHTDAKADRYVDDGELIKFGKFSLECRTTPGHTDCMIVELLLPLLVLTIVLTLFVKLHSKNWPNSC